MAKRKSFNPFKMWGSYVGLIFGAILIFGIFISINYVPPTCTEFPICGEITLGTDCCPDIGSFVCTGIVQTDSCFFGEYLVNFNGFGSFIVGGIIGFLIGWGIHSIFRVARK